MTLTPTRHRIKFRDALAESVDSWLGMKLSSKQLELFEAGNEIRTTFGFGTLAIPPGDYLVSLKSVNRQRGIVERRGCAD